MPADSSVDAAHGRSAAPARAVPASRRGASRPAAFRGPVGVVAALFVLAPVLLAHPGQRAAALLLAAMAAVAVLVAAVPWPRGRVKLAGAAGGMAAASLLVDLVYPGPYRLPAFWLPFEWVALLMLTGRVVRRARGRWAGPVGALVATAVVAVPLRFTVRAPNGGWTASVLAVLTSGVPLAAVVGASVYLRVLDARRERAVMKARREQRLEVARGLHDFVAHEITGIVLEAQAGQLPGDHGAEETAALLRRLEEAGLRALDSMDAMVGALREPQEGGGGGGGDGGWGGEGGEGGGADPPVVTGVTRVYGLADLPELVGRFDRTGPTRARLEAARAVTGLLSAEAEAAAYAVVLEALTNVRRHAPGAAEAVVRVEPCAAAGGTVAVVRVSVSNDGRAPGGIRGLRRLRDSGGTGLPALAERLARYGGTLESGPLEPAPLRPTGWRTSCELPVHQAERQGCGAKSAAEVCRSADGSGSVSSDARSRDRPYPASEGGPAMAAAPNPVPVDPTATDRQDVKGAGTDRVRSCETSVRDESESGSHPYPDRGRPGSRPPERAADPGGPGRHHRGR
ncbi:sensor histidine kinase [Kitasatospora purpeofusca]|uniref:sensor histidine kinase n=1 Tax=Kitasatospora purpeofusca TaxID=67352 RepID=UPI0036E5AA90